LVGVVLTQMLKKRKPSLLQQSFAYKSPQIISRDMLAICPVDQETDCDGRGAVSGMPGAYRRVDGYCNNVRTGWWGSTYAPMQRLLEPDYADGTVRGGDDKVGSISGSGFGDVSILFPFLMHFS
uniref:LCCL domain-containing protein n=1 Tax=Anisakis simplex TaxID=6269 RepID=A0A0M3KKI8_ANISI